MFSFTTYISSLSHNGDQSDKQAITSNDVTRLQFLDGEKGSVACRVHGSSIARPIPNLSKAYTIEYSVGSRLRMQNLIAVRGVPGEGMIGPGDYYGNWYNSDKHCFSISIENGFPTIYQHKLQDPSREPRREITHEDTTDVRVHWTCGKDILEIKKKKEEYQDADKPATGDSLFKDAGILEIHSHGAIHLKKVDTKEVDLTPFKARLVDNKIPFRITKDRIHKRDIWRAVSYQFDSAYAKRQVEHGGGLFLETHNFAQSMTPLDQSAGGYVMLAKWKTQCEKDILQMIAVRIPFGSTLLVEQGCIHGDTTLNGMYMMCMTSNHVTMSSADTVFLKNVVTKKNTDVTVEEEESESMLPQHPLATKPFVMYNGFEDYVDFYKRTNGMSFMFNPLSMGWWKKLGYDVQYTVSYASSGWRFFSSNTVAPTPIPAVSLRSTSMISRLMFWHSPPEENDDGHPKTINASISTLSLSGKPTT
jgi:hypothetical protein